MQRAGEMHVLLTSMQNDKAASNAWLGQVCDNNDINQF